MPAGRDPGPGGDRRHRAGRVAGQHAPARLLVVPHGRGHVTGHLLAGNPLPGGHLAGLLLVAWIVVEVLILRRYFFLQPVIAVVANRLRRAYRPGAVEIVVVDRDGDHVYQPGLLFVPFGLAEARRLTGPRWRQLRSGIIYCQASIDHVDVEHNRVHFGAHRALDYDVLIVATGAQMLPEEARGLTGPGWQKDVSTFYTPEGAEDLHRALERFTGPTSAVPPASATTSGSSRSTRTPPRRRSSRTCSPSATLPTCPPLRPAPSRTSRARCC